MSRLDTILIDFGQMLINSIGHPEAKEINKKQEETVQAIKELFIELIGEDERPAQESSPLEKKLFPDRKRVDYRNEIKYELREKVRGL